METVVKEINTAQTSILIQAFSFTSAPIAKALVDGHKRGVHIEVILDKSQHRKVFLADFVLHAGIPGPYRRRTCDCTQQGDGD